MLTVYLVLSHFLTFGTGIIPLFCSFSHFLRRTNTTFLTFLAQNCQKGDKFDGSSGIDQQ